ncbi:hypothetical protein C479_03566 [Halovivax asiaticus JCM 14624]|uniref:Sulfatase N-terminal domain-containing protein n=1 Tax=Halovivax asiaticus JCM 14624 TaxID=1227490 RepID=M0BUV5_9EURY|nr:hypothetical protein [Halovivax asiaticus]ELZ13892.1 hypothetical protein C479_03566 [Halovivax asiaticus JCM 14624]
MTFDDWVGSTRRRARTDGVRPALREAAAELYWGGLRRLDRLWSVAPTVYERDWDVLIVLDGCRCDLIAEVADEYAFLDAPGRIASPASQSREWIAQTFTADRRDAMAGTAYVAANPYTDALSPADFLLLDEVWRSVWDDELGTVPARPVTDRAIDAARTEDPDRLLVHYMQPHFPSVPDPAIESPYRRGDPGWQPGHVWSQLEAGEVTRERVWRAYRENLQYVLDEVALLLKNVDGTRVAITADHGNAFGEWGVHGHPPRMPLPSLHLVPWYETMAIDRGTHEPDQYDEGETDIAVTEKLRDLGYLGE